jgi:hypothetical protein
MEEPKVIIELETELSIEEKLLVEKFFNCMIDVGDIEIFDAKAYAHQSEFANDICNDVNKINHEDMMANTYEDER